MPKLRHSPPSGPSSSPMPSPRPNPDPLTTSDFANVTIRSSRPPADEDDHCYLEIFKTELKEELQQLFQTWLSKERVEITKVMTQLSEIKEQNNILLKSNEEIEKSMALINSKYEETKTRMESLEKERREIKSYVQILEKKVQDIQQGPRSASIAIRNIPANDKETSVDLKTLVTELGKAIDVPISSAEIRDVYRAPGKPGTNKTIVVELATVSSKTKVIESTRKFNSKKTVKDKLNTEHIGLKGSCQPIYVSEHLPASARDLFRKAREFSKTNSYKFCWVKDGRIYLRKDDKDKHIAIRTEECLQLLNQPA